MDFFLFRPTEIKRQIQLRKRHVTCSTYSRQINPITNFSLTYPTNKYNFIFLLLQPFFFFFFFLVYRITSNLLSLEIHYLDTVICNIINYDTSRYIYFYDKWDELNKICFKYTIFKWIRKYRKYITNLICPSFITIATQPCIWYKSHRKYVNT